MDVADRTPPETPAAIRASQAPLTARGPPPPAPMPPPVASFAGMANLRLPHWAQIALSLTLVIIAWVMNEIASGKLVAPAVVVTVLTLLNTALGLLSASVSPDTNIKAAKRAELRAASVAMTASMLCLLLVACTKAQGAAVATASADAAVCVLNHFSDPPATIAVECGIAEVGDVAKILDAANAMQVRKAAGMKSVSP